MFSMKISCFGNQLFQPVKITDLLQTDNCPFYCSSEPNYKFHIMPFLDLSSRYENHVSAYLKLHNEM
jgi:hypothetical protein